MQKLSTGAIEKKWVEGCISKPTFFSFKSHWENIENSVKLYSDNDSSENNEASISDQYEWISIKDSECSELQGPISDIDGHPREGGEKIREGERVHGIRARRIVAQRMIGKVSQQATLKR